MTSTQPLPFTYSPRTPPADLVEQARLAMRNTIGVFSQRGRVARLEAVRACYLIVQAMGHVTQVDLAAALDDGQPAAESYPWRPRTKTLPEQVAEMMVRDGRETGPQVRLGQVRSADPN